MGPTSLQGPNIRSPMGELAMVWKSHVSTVDMDLTFMLTKLRSWLSLNLQMDIIICILIIDIFKINGCGRWLFLEVIYVFYSL